MDSRRIGPVLPALTTLPPDSNDTAPSSSVAVTGLPVNATVLDLGVGLVPAGLTKLWEDAASLSVPPGSVQHAAILRGRSFAKASDPLFYRQILSQWLRGSPEVCAEVRLNREALGRHQSRNVSLENDGMISAYQTAVGCLIANSPEVFAEANALKTMFLDRKLCAQAFVALSAVADLLLPESPQATWVIEDIVEALFNYFNNRQVVDADSFFYAAPTYAKLFEKCSPEKQMLELGRTRYLIRNPPGPIKDLLVDHYKRLIRTKGLSNTILIEEASEVLSLCRCPDLGVAQNAHVALYEILCVLPARVPLNAPVLAKIICYYKALIEKENGKAIPFVYIAGYALAVFKCSPVLGEIMWESEKKDILETLRKYICFPSPIQGHDEYSRLSNKALNDIEKLYTSLVPYFSESELEYQTNVYRSAPGGQAAYRALIPYVSEDLFFKELALLPNVLQNCLWIKRDDLKRVLGARFFKIRRGKLVSKEKELVIKNCTRLLHRILSDDLGAIDQSSFSRQLGLAYDPKNKDAYVPYGDNEPIHFEEDHGFFIITQRSAAAILERLAYLEIELKTFEGGFRGSPDSARKQPLIAETIFLLLIFTLQSAEVQEESGFPTLPSDFEKNTQKKPFYSSWGQKIGAWVGSFWKS